MPLPTSRDLHVDALLTNYAVAYGQENQDYAAFKGSTTVRVEKESDLYPIWDKGDMFRIEMEKRADGGKSEVGGFRMSTTSYFCHTYALKTQITKRQRNAARNEFDIEKAKVRFLTQQAHMKREKIYATDIFATGKWTSNTEQTGKSASPSTNEFLQWNDSSSTPMKDIQDQMETIHTSTGKVPNIGVTSLAVANVLRRHADFTDLHKYTAGGRISLKTVAEDLGLDDIVVGLGVENTANEQATDSMANIFGKHFLLLHVAASAGTEPENATAITGFAWNEFDGVDENSVAITQWWDDETKSDWYEAEQAFDMKITANDLGLFFKDAVA